MLCTVHFMICQIFVLFIAIIINQGAMLWGFLNTGETKINQQRNRSYRGRNVIGRARFLAVFLELCTRVALVAHAFRLVAPCAASRFVCGFVPIVYVTVSSMRRLERVSRVIEWYVKMCRFQWKRMKSEGHAAGLSLCVSFAFQSRPMLLCRIRIPMKALSAVAGGARTQVRPFSPQVVRSDRQRERNKE